MKKTGVDGIKIIMADHLDGDAAATILLFTRSW